VTTSDRPTRYREGGTDLMGQRPERLLVGPTRYCEGVLTLMGPRPDWLGVKPNRFAWVDLM